MNRIGLAVIGAGNLQCGTAIIGSLGSYFGERPLDIVFYDPDPERLELFTRLGKVCFASTKATHLLWNTADPAEALSIAERVILSLDAHGAAKYVASLSSRAESVSPQEALSAALPTMLEGMLAGATLLSLMPPEVRIPLSTYFRLEWPDPMADEELTWLPHQLNRWIRGDEYMFELIQRHERSPFKAWLDSATTATLVDGG